MERRFPWKKIGAPVAFGEHQEERKPRAHGANDMATGQMSSIAEHLHRAALLHDGGGLTDGQLLERFFARHEDAAFETLVRRHGPMVLGSALTVDTTARRMLARRLARRGPTLSAGSLAVVLAPRAAPASVPMPLVVSTVKAASGAAGETAAGVLSPQVSALAEGVLKAMFSTRLRIVTALVLIVGALGIGGVLSYRLAATEPPEAPRKAEPPPADNVAVQKVLDQYRSFRPDEKDLAIFRLDWVPTLKDAREKAAREERPIFLLVVTNSFGNLHSGHC
jgi:hypothetical protein